MVLSQGKGYPQRRLVTERNKRRGFQNAGNILVLYLGVGSLGVFSL